MATERRLIDANALLPNGVFYVNGNDPMTSLDELLRRIANAPTVDAVEVVRCKDCEHCYYSKMYNKMWCGDNVVNPDDFCSYGERRTDNG